MSLLLTVTYESLNGAALFCFRRASTFSLYPFHARTKFKPRTAHDVPRCRDSLALDGGQCAETQPLWWRVPERYC